MWRRTAGIVAFAVLLGLSTQSSAQERSDLGSPPVQYNFAPPGARSLAMGAAFIGLADDATASESNPAGLTVLTKPEFSLHLRYSEFENEVPNTVSGEGFDTFTSRVGSPSFFSVVVPTKHAAVSLYYQRSADFRNASTFNGLLPDGTFDTDTVDIGFRVENLGLSAAFKLGDKVSVGGSVRATRTHLEATQAILLANDPLGANQFNYTFNLQGTADESKTKATWNAGVLFTPVSKLSLGGVYKSGADFDFRQTVSAFLAFPNGPSTPQTNTQATRLTVPDVFGGGLAFRPSDQFTIVADVVEIKYAQTDQVDFSTNPPGGRNFYQRFGQGGPEPIEDATEIHVGAEYTWSKGSDWLFAVRGGFYTDPDHDGLAGIDSKADHVTFGGGVVVKNAMQVDVAANIADRVKEGLISFVFRF